MNSFLQYTQGPSGVIARLIVASRESCPDDSTLAYAELLHDVYCKGEHIDDEEINDGYCSWLDEELEDEWFSQWGRKEHHKWQKLAEHFINVGIDPETAILHSNNPLPGT